jgi:signal transduction histidine kinase
VPLSTGGHAWQWAAGGFLFFVGGAMLVAPHEYDVIWRALPMPYPVWWGSIYLLGGLALLALATLVTVEWFSTVAYLLAATLLFVMAAAYASVGRWMGIAGYAPLAAGCMLGWFIERRALAGGITIGATQVSQADLLKSALGICGALSGLVLLAAPAHSADPAFDPLRPLLPWSGLVLLVAGSGLAVLPLLHLPAGRRRLILNAASVASGALCILYVAQALSQGSEWPGIAYYAWFGFIFLAQPFLAPRAHSLLVPGSLRTWLACMLAAAAAVPLIIVVALDSDHMERAVRADALAGQQVQVAALAEGIARYMQLNQAALRSLAGQPGLAALSPAEQTREIDVFRSSFPGFLSFSLYRADGTLAASAGAGAPPSLAGDPNYEAVRRTGQPGLEVVPSPERGQPVIYLAAPVPGQNAAFAGLVVGALESNRIADLMSQETQGRERFYLVTERGRVIVHPDPGLVAASADLSRSEAVAQALGRQAKAGSLTYTGDQGEVLAGDGRVPGLGWIVVVEQPADQVLRGVRETRSLVFDVLLLSLVITAAAGWWVAGRLARPLAVLANAAAALARGNADAPLPQTRVLESRQLAGAFRQMREQLTAHATELSDAAGRLSAANQSLDQSQTQLRALTRRLLELQEAERRALSRDLHDTAAQSLTALKLGIGALARHTDCPDTVQGQVYDLQELCEGVMDDLHRLAVNLRPASLDRSGLVPALEQLVASFTKQYGIETGLFVHGMPEGTRLPGPAETTLYRIVQESLTNIARHAGASQVGIVVHRISGGVQIIIEDDGAGFDADEAFRRGRLGLLGMRERAEMAGGTLEIESSPGHGATVIATVPVEEQPEG